MIYHDGSSSGPRNDCCSGRWGTKLLTCTRTSAIHSSSFNMYCRCWTMNQRCRCSLAHAACACVSVRLFVGRHCLTMCWTLVTWWWARCVHRRLPLPTQAGSRYHSASTDRRVPSLDSLSTCCVWYSCLSARLSSVSWPLTPVLLVLNAVLLKSSFPSVYDCHLITYLLLRQAVVQKCWAEKGANCFSG